MMRRRTIGVRLRRVVRAGWVRLVIRGLPADAQEEVRLVLRHARTYGGDVEHVIAPAAGGVERVMHVTAPLDAAHLILTEVVDRTASVEAGLTPIGRLALLRHAARIDPRETLAALSWRVVGKKVRARNRLLRLFGATQRLATTAWLEREAPVWASEVEALTASLGVSTATPRFAVMVVSRDRSTPAQIASSVASVRRQIMPVSACLESHAQRDAVLETARNRQDWDWLVVLPAGVLLTEDAVLRMAGVAANDRKLAAIYGDSISLADNGSVSTPELKPQWNAALYLTRDYVGMFAVSREAMLRMKAAAGTEDAVDCLLLAASEPNGRSGVRRVARLLTQRPIDLALATPAEREVRRASIERHLLRTDSSARVELESGGLRVIRALPSPAPLVSLIVPTRDRLDLLEPCIEGLRHRTDYPALEILIADNHSRKAATRAYFATLGGDTRVRVIDCPGPFNFAAINNRAVAAAKGSVLGFINNDIEVMDASWLREMVGRACHAGTGAVGARLLYASGLVQHGGVILGIGGYAGHAHRFFDPRSAGYMGRLGCAHHVAAVTAACLVVERSKFEAVGGFDADAFAVAYNDVDLCLKLRARGYDNLFTPHATLKHKESASRVRDYAPERAAAYARECALLTERWGALIADDPAYHPALTRTDETFSLL